MRSIHGPNEIGEANVACSWSSGALEELVRRVVVLEEPRQGLLLSAKPGIAQQKIVFERSNQEEHPPIVCFESTLPAEAVEHLLGPDDKSLSFVIG